MKFFIPHARDDSEAEHVYEASKKFCEQQTGWRVLPKRIYALRYRHDGKEYFAQVGSEDPTEGLVICIFESEVTYFVCTPNRGVARGDPILVGKGEVSDIQIFDDEEAQPNKSP
jgi:hypothetical protein